jgi:hypothetical protein
MDIQIPEAFRIQWFDMNLGNLYRLSSAKSRSISPENPPGEEAKEGMATLETGTAKKCKGS